MNSSVCNICGANYEYRNGRWVCPACGAYKQEELSNEEATLLYNASQTLRLCDFDAAERQFSDIIEKFPCNPNGYWGRVLARFGIKYEEDFDGRKIPTCYAASIESFINDRDFKVAMSWADPETKAYFQQQANYIDRVRKEWVTKAQKEKPYDVFICYKDSDLTNGINRTKDSIDAQELYAHLVTQGYRVFFSRESLRDKVGEKYEPYIFNALQTAKVMVVFGSRADYITSTWLKNEWTRYEKRIKAGEKKPNSLIVACEGFSPNELPKMLSSKQCLNAAGPAFYSDLDAAISKIVRPEPKAEPKPAAPQAPTEQPKVKVKKKHKYLLPILLVTLVPTLMLCAVLVTKVFLQKTISFDQDSAGKLQSQTVTSGQDYTLPLYKGTKDNYIFAGWSKTKDGTVDYADGATIADVSKDIELYAVWEGIPLTLTFLGNDDTQTQTYTVPYGDTFVMPDCAAEMVGYTFGGWTDADGNSAQADEKIVIYKEQTWQANWTANENTIVYTANGGDGEMPNLVYRTGDVVQLDKCTYTRSGYHFVGWATSLKGSAVYDDCAVFDGTPETKTYLYAVWEKNSYHISYVLNGGTNSADNPEWFGVLTPTIELAAPTKAGYVFKGWYTDAALQNENDVILYGSEGDKVFYAAWEEEKYTVTFFANGGNGTMNSMTVGVETAGTISACTFTKQGYNCTGWATEKNGAAVYTEGDTIVAVVDDNGNVTCPEALYAVWEIIPHTYHTPEIDAAVAPTCTKTGLTEGSHCSVCGEVIVAQKTISQTPHTYQDTIVAPTTAAQGYTEHVCTVCGYSYKDTWVDKLQQPDTSGLAFALNSDNKSYSVTGIGNNKNTNVVIPSTYNSLSVTGISSFAFYGCTTMKTLSIPDSVSSIGDYAFNNCTNLTKVNIPGSVTSIGVGIFVDCTGLTSITVDTQNTVYHSAGNCLIKTAAKELIAGCKSSVIPTDGSVTSIGERAFEQCLGLTSVTVPSSVTSIGICAFSGCTGLTAITYSGTTAQWQNISKSYGWRISTTFVIHCTDGDVDKDENVIAASSEGLKYSLNSDGKSYSVTGIGTCKDTNVVIPSTYNGNQVTSIGAKAFYCCYSLTCVTIPNSVISIGNYAFENCTGLTSITMPDSVMDIGNGVFSGCAGLVSITVNKNNKVYYSAGNCIVKTETKELIAGCKNSVIPTDGSVTSISEGAFSDCVGLTSITIPDSITSIGNSAFFGCTGLTSITIPNSVSSMGEGAFFGCSGLTSITIPNSVTSMGDELFSYCTGLTSVTISNSVTSIGYSVFRNCTGLASITVDKNNPVYRSEGNCLIKTAAKELVAGCKNSVIPTDGSVTSISKGAFKECKGLISFTIPNGVTSIGNEAFMGCIGLTSITISNSVTSIGNYAFYDCTGLTAVTYSGTTIQWQAITKGSNWRYNTTFVIHCSNGDMDKDGNVIGTSSAGLKYYYNSETKTYYVTGIGTCKDTDIIIPSTYNGYSVTIIDSYAFENCTGITSVTIPDSVTTIGRDAFNGCSNLNNITLPPSVTVLDKNVFLNCTRLVNISIPNGVTYIDDCAFSGCTGLTSITIPGSVTAIEGGAFRECTGLTSIIIPNSVTTIGCGAFNGCTSLKSITIPSGVTFIDDKTFYNCVGLESVTISNGVTYIDDCAFYGCTGLTSITIPGSVTTIISSAFSNCNNLTTITVDAQNTVYHSAGNCIIKTATKELIVGCKNSVIPTDGSVTSIGSYAFYTCKELTSITIPKGVTSIGNYAFYQCIGLTSITIPNTVTSIGAYAFSGCTNLTAVTYSGTTTQWQAITKGNNWRYNTTFVIHCSNGDVDKDGNVINAFSAGLKYSYNSDTKTYSVTGIGTCKDTEVVVPSSYNGYSVTAIDSRAFENCTGITSVTIPDSVTTIDYGAFRGCIGLKSITIPNSITTIDCDAFSGCVGLKSITIPSGVTFIDNNAFLNCTGLVNITIPYGVTYIDDCAFYGCTGLKSIRIPGSVTTIIGSAFSNCTNLTTITVDAQNTVYHSAGNCIIKTAAKELIVGCKNSEIPTDGSVTSIGELAFFDCDSLISITIPSGVTSIGEGAFALCDNLTSVTIASSVTVIGDDAFEDCVNLATITYGGTITQWTAALGEHNDSYYDDIIIQCSDGKIDHGQTVYDTPATTGSIGLDYSLNSDGQTYTVTGIGSCQDTNLVIPSTFNGCAVTAIETRAFYCCKTIENVIIQSGVNGIGTDAFSGCTNLTAISIPDSITRIDDNVFYSCPQLIYTTSNGAKYVGNDSNPYYALVAGTATSGIHANTKVIAGGAFYKCIGLTNITIPDGVVSICQKAFTYSGDLATVSIPNSVIFIGSYAFYGCSQSLYTNYNGGKYIGNSSNPYLVLIEGTATSGIHSNTKYIDGGAFFNCTDLNSISIPNGVKSVGDQVFRCCNLENVAIPNSVTEYDRCLFTHCELLTEVTLSTNATKLSEYMFNECTRLSTITIPDTVTIIETGAFSGCSNLTNIVIPNSITSVGASAFYGCTKLVYNTYNGGQYLGNSSNPYLVLIKGTATSGIHPNTKVIADAFNNCTELTNITIPNGVNTIGECAFKGGTNLTSITIPSTVTRIEKRAFYGTSITSIMYQGTISQWYLVSKTRQWDESSQITVIHCTDGDVSIN